MDRHLQDEAKSSGAPGFRQQSDNGRQSAPHQEIITIDKEVREMHEMLDQAENEKAMLERPTLPAPPAVEDLEISTVRDTLKPDPTTRDFQSRETISHVLADDTSDIAVDDAGGEQRLSFWMYAGLGVGLLLVIGAVVYAGVSLSSRFEGQVSQEMEPPGEVPRHRASKRGNAAKAEAARDDALGKQPERPTETMIHRTVFIDIQGIPSGAVVRVGDVEMNLPITLPQAEESIKIEVVQGDALVYSTSIIPRVSQVIEIPVVEKRQRKHRRSNGDVSTNKGGRTSPASDNAAGNLSSNPYSLRTNPFAKGE